MPYKDKNKAIENKKEYYLKNKEYHKEYNKKYYLKNKEKLKEDSKKYYHNNIEQHRNKQKEYIELNKEKIKEYNKNYQKSEKFKSYTKLKYKKNKKKIIEYTIKYNKKRRKLDLNFKIKGNLRSRLREAVKNKQKKGSAVRDLGCSVEKFVLWIEMRWIEGMNWSNYGNKNGCWSFDHIKPLSKFNLENREEFLEACHFTNIQPMWVEDNILKGNKE